MIKSAIGEPHYIESQRRLASNPNAEHINLCGYVINNSDPTPTYIAAQERLANNPDAERLEAPHRPAIAPVAGPPHYMERGNAKKAKAEAIATAVRLAIERGEIDASVFE